MTKLTDKQIEVTAEQVEKMLDLHASSERRLDKAIESNSGHVAEYRAECLAIEQMLDILGIEWC